jgi:hypothetical protein
VKTPIWKITGVVKRSTREGGTIRDDETAYIAAHDLDDAVHRAEAALLDGYGDNAKAIVNAVAKTEIGIVL